MQKHLLLFSVKEIPVGIYEAPFGREAWLSPCEVPAGVGIYFSSLSAPAENFTIRQNLFTAVIGGSFAFISAKAENKF